MRFCLMHCDAAAAVLDIAEKTGDVIDLVEIL